MDKVLLPTYGFKTQFTKIEQINPLCSMGRVRILYPDLNRNSVDIAKEVADQMATTLPYTPVVGVFIEKKDDFGDHEESLKLVKRAYGCVAAEPNAEWEEVEEEDGTKRSYLCADVLLWTSRYPEATKIIDEEKGQSMELDPKTIEGRWYYKNGKRVFKVSKAFFSALCVLGDDVEPCFESAGFYKPDDNNYSLVSDSISSEFKEMLTDFGLIKPEGGKTMENLETNLPADGAQQTPPAEGNTAPVTDFTNQPDNTPAPAAENNPTPEQNSDGKGKEEYVVSFKLYNDDIRAKLYRAINKDQWIYEIIKMSSDYAVIYNWNDGNYYRQPFSYNETEVSYDEEQRTRVTLIDVTVEEEQALNAAKAEGATNFQKLETELTTIKTDLEKQLNDVKTEFANSKTQYEEQVKSLKEKLLAFQRAEKEAVIEKFSKLLEEKDIAPIKEKIDEFSAIDLEKELALVTVRTKVNFNLDSDKGEFVFSNVSGATQKQGWEALVIPKESIKK